MSNLAPLASDPVQGARGAWNTRDPVVVCLLVLSATGFYAISWPPAYGACLLILAGLTFARLDLALALVPGFAPFAMEPKYIGHLTFVPTEILIGLDLVVACALIVLRRSPAPHWRRIRASPFLLPACVFLLAVTVSTVAAPNRHLALHAYRERVLDPLAYVVLLLLFVRDRRNWYWILGGLVAGGATAGIIGLGQFALQRGLSTVNGTGIQRVEALYGSPDNLGLLLDRVVPVWLVLALTMRGGQAQRWAVRAVGILLVVPLILTFSLGAWIAIALVAAGILLLLRSWGKWLVLGLAVICAVAVGAKYHSFEHAFQSGHANSTQTRLDVWHSSFQMIRDRPVLGIGPDNFQRLYAPTRSQDKYNTLCAPGQGYMQPGAGAEPCLSHPHDELLDFWLSSGILGLIAYVWILIVFWRVGLTLWRRSSGAEVRWTVLAVMAAMLAGIIHGAIDNSYFLADLAIFFWLFCAVVSWYHDETRVGTSGDARLDLAEPRHDTSVAGADGAAG